MYDTLIVVLLLLSTYGLSYALAESRIFRTPRETIQERLERRWEARHLGESDPDEWQSGVAYLLSCIKCTSVWVGGAATVTADIAVGIPVPVLVWTATFGFTMLANRGS